MITTQAARPCQVCLISEHTIVMIFILIPLTLGVNFESSQLLYGNSPLEKNTPSFNPANGLLSWIVGPAALVPNTRYLHNWHFPGIVPERLGDELQEIINNKDTQWMALPEVRF